MLQALTIIGISYMLYFIFRLILKNVYFMHIYLSSLFWCVLVLLAMLAIASHPKQSFEAALQGINLCINVVFPSLFPFFVVTDLLVNMGVVQILKALLEPVMRPLFNVPGSGAFAFCMGIISGYPVGAKITADLYSKGLCSKEESERLLSFCNNSGPLFILGAVAVGMFNSPSSGIILFISHIAASLTVGFLFRYYKYNSIKSINVIDKRTSPINSFLNKIRDFKRSGNKNFGELFGDAIKKSVNLLLIICGFIIFFSVLIHLLMDLKIISLFSHPIRGILNAFGFSPELALPIASGFFEITTGIRISSMLNSVPIAQKLAVTSLILGWAGLSVHCQVISIISKAKISVIPYLAGKGMHGILSAIYTFFLCKYLPLYIEVALPLASPLFKPSNFEIINSFLSSLVYLGSIIFLLVLFCIFAYIQNKS
ncbi:MAG: sporulation integral membrane protein YlbJ [Clostridiaceae bacterium]|nr:sporulation integral membrane protein YlbJ [Clostridiaceae bacterium]